MLLNRIEMETDIAVIGGGGAALRAAYEAEAAGCGVIVISKGRVGFSGATAISISDLGGINIADGYLCKEDSPERHYNDIVNAGLGMCNKNLARILTVEALKEKDFLEGIGVRFHKENGEYLINKPCFSETPRCYTIYGHGKSIVKALKGRIDKGRQVKFLDNCVVTNIITQRGVCCGVVAFSDGLKSIVVVKSKAVILTAGGGGQLFRLCMNPQDVTGDGNALAFRAGAKLANLEFIQFGLGTVYPKLLSVSYWMVLMGPRFLNGKNEEFLSKYIPEGLTVDSVTAEKTHYPFSSRDNARFIETAIHNEIIKGNAAANGGVLLDLTHLSAKDERKLIEPLRKVWQVTKEWFESKGVDVTKKPLTVADYCHAFNGGVVINERAETSVEGLYAAGENAAGPHGADRLGGNMLLTCQVFGKIAGVNAAQYAKNTALNENRTFVRNETDRLCSLLDGTNPDADEKIEGLTQTLKNSNWERLGVARNEAGIGKALEVITEAQETVKEIKVSNTRSLKRLLELSNMLTVSKMIATAANMRKESRGSHNREDYPQINDEWEKNIIIKKVNGNPEFSKGYI
ncbi:MAG: FAD-binding protein [Clostridiales bacterium]|nr:FAD-binding protein [Clostridiales bacterium]